MPPIITTSRSTSTQSSRNEESRRTQRQQEQQQEVHAQEERAASRRASSEDYRNVNSQTLHDAMENARSVGSSFAEVTMANGEVVLFPVQNQNQNPAIPQAGDIPDPAALNHMTDAELQAQGYTASEIQSIRQDAMHSDPSQIRTANFAYSAGQSPSRNSQGRFATDQNASNATRLLNDLMTQNRQNEQVNDVRQQTRKIKNQLTESGEQLKMIMMLMKSRPPPMDIVVMLIVKMMIKSERDLQRIGVSQAEKCNIAKTRLLTAIASKPYPALSVNRESATAQANQQKKLAEYQNWMSVSNQVMSTVNDNMKDVTENLISSPQKNINFLMEFQKNFNDEEFRIKRKIMS